jgi:UDPglucose 6-dehydrogenase
MIDNKVTLYGVGKLGLCFALNLERAGFDVLGVDVDNDYVNSINTKSLVSAEESVNELLKETSNFRATIDPVEGLDHSDTLFVFVATPSIPTSGKYDHSQIHSLVEELKAEGRQPTLKDLIIGCTVMPGFCDRIQEELRDYNYRVSYNPEFIAQGTVIRDQQYPDMILIGSSDLAASSKIRKIYEKIVLNFPHYHVMSPLSAEICKISLNCYITTKIAFTNMIGDLATQVGAQPQLILDAIGSDSRVGGKCTRYGYGYGGPCFPRDNRALGVFAKEKSCYIDISDATDACNQKHLKYMVKIFPPSKNSVEFESVSYKPESIILEESQQLAYAVELARQGIEVIIRERPQVIKEIKEKYRDLFIYEER